MVYQIEIIRSPTISFLFTIHRQNSFKMFDTLVFGFLGFFFQIYKKKNYFSCSDIQYRIDKRMANINVTVVFLYAVSHFVLISWSFVLLKKKMTSNQYSEGKQMLILLSFNLK